METFLRYDTWFTFLQVLSALLRRDVLVADVLGAGLCKGLADST